MSVFSKVGDTLSEAKFKVHASLFFFFLLFLRHSRVQVTHLGVKKSAEDEVFEAQRKNFEKVIFVAFFFHPRTLTFLHKSH
jgi:hypothetical protein